MKVRDAIQMLEKSFDLDQHIVISWWDKESVYDSSDDEMPDDEMPEAEWVDFNKYIRGRMDWSGCTNEINQSYIEYSRERKLDV